MPEILKSLLVDDWENVTKNNQVVSLPSTTPCSALLDDYSAYETPNRAEGSAEADILEEVTKGLKEYFSLSVGRVLLYKQEKPQYAAIWKRINSSTDELSGKRIYEIYGAEHLIRLLGECRGVARG
jgi:mortality factor 4-like protein 1